MDSENPECLLNTVHDSPLRKRKSFTKILLHPDLVACVALKWCSMRELLHPENKSHEERALQGPAGKDGSYFRLTWSVSFGSLDGYLQLALCAGRKPTQFDLYSWLCFSLKISISAPFMASPEGLRNPFPLWEHSSVCSQKTAFQTVLPCLGQDPGQSWDVMALQHVLFHPLTPWASSRWV